jgi:hypothetical protein
VGRVERQLPNLAVQQIDSWNMDETFNLRAENHSMANGANARRLPHLNSRLNGDVACL